MGEGYIIVLITAAKLRISWELGVSGRKFFDNERIKKVKRGDKVA
jgi:hypothetical protein